jgi:hypothetical protein
LKLASLEFPVSTAFLGGCAFSARCNEACRLLAGVSSAWNALNKLTRTFGSQVEALKRYRSGGEQKVTVQDVHVADGGQAMPRVNRNALKHGDFTAEALTQKREIQALALMSGRQWRRSNKAQAGGTEKAVFG